MKSPSYRIKQPVLKAVVGTFALFSLSACTLLTTTADKPPEETAQKLTLTAETLQTPRFGLQTQSRIKQAGDDLTIYIEAEVSASSKPLSLRMALQDPAPNVVWLVQPCYLSSDRFVDCNTALWHPQRYHPARIEAINTAIEQIKTQSGAKKLHLIGHSGGGTIALLIAAKRQDVATVKTIAANLDTDAFARNHQIIPVAAESNPLRHAAVLKNIAQNHWLGQNDEIVPPYLANKYANQVGKGNCLRLQVVPNASHDQGWEKRWLDFLNTPLPC